MMKKGCMGVQVEVYNLFAAYVHQDGEQRTRQICVPDLGYLLNGHIEVLGDVKCINVCPSRYSGPRMDTRAGAVKARQTTITAEYRRKMVQGDRMYNGTAEGDIGPLERRLQAYGRVRGFVFGAYGEASTDVETMVSLIAHGQAGVTWRDMGARTPTEAAAVLKDRATRWLGVAGARAHAALKLSRLQDAFGGPRRDANDRRRASEYEYRQRRASYQAFHSPADWGG